MYLQRWITLYFWQWGRQAGRIELYHHDDWENRMGSYHIVSQYNSLLLITYWSYRDNFNIYDFHYTQGYGKVAINLHIRTAYLIQLFEHALIRVRRMMWRVNLNV